VDREKLHLHSQEGERLFDPSQKPEPWTPGLHPGEATETREERRTGRKVMDTSVNSFGSNDGLNLDAFISLACLVVRWSLVWPLIF
jgi:hypothetical protein